MWLLFCNLIKKRGGSLYSLLIFTFKIITAVSSNLVNLIVNIGLKECLGT